MFKKVDEEWSEGRGRELWEKSDANRKILLLNPFVVSFKNISLK